jgi:hypothetical protein
MHHLRCRLIAFGFLWMALWAVFGSLLGYRLQEEIIAGQSNWVDSLERSLMRSAHAHMNSMALVAIVTGLVLPIVGRTLSARTLGVVSLALPGSIAVFGAGLVWEAFAPPQAGVSSMGSIVAALGGSVFIIIVFCVGVATLWSSRRRL